MFGEDALETDEFVRTLGWRRVAEQELPLLSPDTRALPRVLLRRASTPTSTSTRRASSRWSTPSWVSVGSTTRRRSGRRSTRWPGSRRWRGISAATSTTRSDRSLDVADLTPGRRSRELYPRLPVRRARADRRIRARSSTASIEQNASTGGTDAPRVRPPGRTPRARRCAVHQAADAVDRLLGHRRRHRVQRLGGLGRPHRQRARRSSPTTRTSTPSMPSVWYQMGLHCNEVECRLPLRRQRVHVRGRAGRRDRPQPDDRLGFHQPLPRHAGPLPGEGVDDDTLPVRRQAAAS